MDGVSMNIPQNTFSKMTTPVFNLCRDWNNLLPYEMWKELGSPKYVCAPMVDQSELAFRMITRKYGTELTFTPMVHSVLFSTQDKYRARWLSDISLEEQPCFVQFCGHDPEILLQAAKYVEKKTPCVDLNLGCPQGIAKRGYYGSFLLENEGLVLKILNYLSNNLKCGVSCKIRLFPDLERSFNYVKQIEATGIKVLTVHGRTKEQNKHLTGFSNWEAIRFIKESVGIPVIANGGIETFENVVKCLEFTKCDAVMSAEKLLECPFLFSGHMYDLDDIALEYIELSKKIENDINFCRSHLFKFYYQACKMDMIFNDKISEYKTYDQFIELANDIKDFRKSNNVRNEDKFGWYFRYRKIKEENGKSFDTNQNTDSNLESYDGCDISNIFG